MSAVTKYYYHGGTRVALRQGDVVYYLHGDHLGSTSLTTDQDGVPVAQTRYRPYGEERWTGETTQPTDFTFTGQRVDSYIKLIEMGARWYDPQVGRWISPDSIIPDYANPQALNRYAYTLGNPLRYTDPSGFDPLDPEWEQAFWDEHNRAPSEQDKRDRLFSVMFLGSGPEGTWTDADWEFYHQNRDRLWSGKGDPWPGAENPGLERFVSHVRRLASEYGPDEHGLFVRAFAFVFGGVPYDTPWMLAAASVIHGPQNWMPLYEGSGGWNPELVDDPNPSHHYAGLFFLGYFTQVAPIGKAVNFARDSDNAPDIKLGNIAVDQGVRFRLGYSEASPSQSHVRSYRTWIHILEESLSMSQNP